MEEIYRLLADGDAGERMRVRARDRLEREGVDVDRIVRDFVSHPTIGAHLKECAGVEPPRSDEGDQVQKAEERVFKLQNRMEAVVRGTVEHLRDTGRVSAEDFDVFVNARVVCDRCGTQYDVHDFLRREGCRCAEEE